MGSFCLRKATLFIYLFQKILTMPAPFIHRDLMGYNNSMLKDAQKQIDDLVQQYDPPYWAPLSQFARLSEEVGEVARLLNHMYGAKPKKKDEAEQKLGEELADVLFTLICLANAHNIDLDTEFQGVIDKFNARDKDRFTKKT